MTASRQRNEERGRRPGTADAAAAEQPTLAPSEAREPDQEDNRIMPATASASPAATHSVLITGPTGSGKTAELARRLADVTSRGAEAWAATRRPADLAELHSQASLTRTAATPDEVASMISDAHSEMQRRYALMESGSAGAADFTPLVIAADDYDLLVMDAHDRRQEDSDAGQSADPPMIGHVGQLLQLAEAARMAVALTGFPGLARGGHLISRTACGTVRHVRLPVPPASRRGPQPQSLAAYPPRRGVIAGRHPDRDIAPGMESADTEGEISILQEQAAERIKTIAGHMLPGVRVEILEWDENAPDAPPDPGVAWQVRKLQITHDEPALVTKAENREAFRQHMSLQLFGEPSALRAEWALSLTRVVLGRRLKFAEKIPHRPAHGRPSGETVIPYATTEDGDVATLQLSGTDTPHTLLTGGAGRGATASARVIALEAARQGIDVRLCNPKYASVEGLRDWPNITVAWQPPEIIKLIDGTYDEMLARYAGIEDGRALARDYPRVLLLVDGLPVIAMLVNDLWAAVKEPAQPARHPALRKLDALTAMGRGASMNVVVTAHSAGSLLPGALAENLGSKIALGGQSRASAIRMFGSAVADQGIPPCPPGEGVTQTASGLTRIKVHWLPDPGDWDTLSAAERQLLQDMRPPGAPWDGPPPTTGEVPA